MKNLIVILFILSFPAIIFGNVKEKNSSYKPNTAIIRLHPGYNINDIQNMDFVKIKHMLRPELSLKMNPQKRKSDKSLSDSKIKEIINTEEPLLRTFIINYEENLSPIDYCKHLLMNYSHIIEIAEPYYIYRKLEAPNDPMLGDQSGLLDLIKAKEAWEINNGNPDIIIGISDNGIAQFHEDLYPNIAINTDEIDNDGIDNDNNGYIDDYSGYNLAAEIDGQEWGNTHVSDGHGTDAAGIAAAAWNNDLGIAGIGGRCRMFPLKIALADQPRNLMFSYESIIVAANIGCKVLNCSWGDVKPYSDIDQSIIDYAVSKDVVIVASGGNLDSYSTTTSTFYPAGYRGVLGVGEVNYSDQFQNVVGVPVRIMAPSGGNLTTSVSGVYRNVGGGTSFSSPVVAGAIGIARSAHPELSVRQVQEFVRQCTDDISDKNQHGMYSNLIPGRLNMLKIVTDDPLAKPGIAVEDYTMTDVDGNVSDRFVNTDIVNLKIDVKNYLGEGRNLHFVLTRGYDFNNTVEIIDSLVIVPKLETDATAELVGFKFKVINELSDKIIFRVNVTGDGGFTDFFKVEFTPNTDITTFFNDVLAFSVADRGTFGFNSNYDNQSGIGIRLNNQPNQLYEGGIMATESNSKLASSVFGADNHDFNDFRSVEPYVYPNINRSIIDDAELLGDKIGIEITQEFFLPTGTAQYTKAFVTIKNISGKTLNDLAVGYYFDYDIADDADFNVAGLLPEAIPDTFVEIAAAAEYIGHADPGHQYFGAATISSEANAVPQATSVNYAITHSSVGFRVSDQIKTLNSGTSWQIDNVDDVSIVVGMKFEGATENGQERKCIVCIGGGETKAELAAQLMNCLMMDSVEMEFDNSNIRLFPQPAKDYVVIQSEGKIVDYYRIVDVMGNYVLSGDMFDSFDKIDLSSLATGRYMIIMNIGADIISLPLIIVR